MGKQRNVKKGEKMGKKWTCPFACLLFFFLFFRFVFLFLFCIFFVFFCFLPGKKQNKSKIKTKKKQTKSKSKKPKKCKKNANGQVHFFPIFSPFLSFLFFPFFFLFILLLCFLDFADLLFGFPIFLHFSRFFSSLKKIRINGGLVNINVIWFMCWRCKMRLTILLNSLHIVYSNQ